MHENEIATAILDICFQIHKQYGPGLLESVYEEILVYELRKAGHFVERQKWVHIIHDELRVRNAFRADLIVDHLVLVELKSVSDLHKDYYKVVNTYLRLTHIKLGLLINFSAPVLREGIRRIVNNL